MTIRLRLFAVALAAWLPTAADAQDGTLPRDLTRRTELPEAGSDGPLPWPLRLFASGSSSDGGVDSSTERYRTDTSLGALHARNRYGTTWTCIGDNCAGVTPTPISPEDRAVLMQRGIKALPPDAPVFQKAPTAD